MLLLKKFRILGHSMEPAIKYGDFVLVSSIPYYFSPPKEKDIIAFNYKDKILIKRIIKIQDEELYLEGDNKNDSLDSRSFGKVKKSDILGRVIYK